MARDEELIEKIKNGNISSFETLIKKYKNRVYILIMHIVKDHKIVEDLVQEVFLTVYENIKKFKGRSSFYTWLYRISVNTALSYLKKTKKELEFIEDMGDSGSYQEMDEKLISRELIREVFRVANTLPKKEKLIFILKFKNGFSNGEIAEILGMSRDSVKANLYHALKKIRFSLKKKGLLEGE